MRTDRALAFDNRPVNLTLTASPQSSIFDRLSFITKMISKSCSSLDKCSEELKFDSWKDQHREPTTIVGFIL